jgi:putative ABC transport system permease protein
MAWREGRAARGRLLVLAAGIAAGVAALVAVNALAGNVRDSVVAQSQALLGADLRFASGRRLPDSAARVVDSVASLPGATAARVTTFSAMALAPRTGGVRPVTVTAIEGGYPLYGAPATAPAALWPGVERGDRAALVDSALLAGLELHPGDTLVIGGLRVAIAGAVARYPGDVSLASGFSPRVILPSALLEEVRLLGFGSRAQYETFVRLADPSGAEELAERLEPGLREQRVRVRSAAEQEEDTADAFERLGRFLGLVALVALLLGGLGTASAIRVLIAQKLDTVATLRCLGAGTALVLAIYLLQAGLLGALGGLAGGLAGIALQLAVPRLVAEFVPVDLVVTPGWGALAAGVAAGLWVAAVFALLPLLAVRRVPPLAALRRDVEPVRRRDPLRWVAMAVIAASVAGVAWWQAGEWKIGLGYAGAVGAALLVLWLVAAGLVWLVRRRPPALPYPWRQGLANLQRPGNQTTAVVMALGFGAFLLGTLVLVQHNLLRRFTVGEGARANVVLFDVQPDQLEDVRRVLRESGTPEVGAPVPIVPMRLRAVDGTAVQALPDTLDDGRERAGWALRREYRSTWRDTLTATELLLEGRWRPGREPRPAGSPVRVAVERDLAQELGIGVGSRLTWDVQGVTVESEVAAIREVDWGRFEPNFFVVFEGGALEEAPHTWVTLADIASPADRGRLQRVLVEAHPNVAVIDVTQVVERIQAILDRVVFAVRFLAFFSLGTGVVVLVGAVAASRMARIRETALLRTLGATRAQLLRVAAGEYLALGGLAALAGGGLALVAGWVLAARVFRTPYGVPAVPLLALVAGVVGLTVLGGVLQAAAIARRRPREVLAGE